jgi:hypothetical protein
VDVNLSLNLLWFVPLIAWLSTRNRSHKLSSFIIGASFGLVVPYASVGLYALHFAWPVSEAFGQLGFYLSFFHDLAGIRVAILLKLVSAHSPISDDQRPLIDIVNILFWVIAYGALGFLCGLLLDYFRNKTP